MLAWGVWEGKKESISTSSFLTGRESIGFQLRQGGTWSQGWAGISSNCTHSLLVPFRAPVRSEQPLLPGLRALLGAGGEETLSLRH